MNKSDYAEYSENGKTIEVMSLTLLSEQAEPMPQF